MYVCQSILAYSTAYLIRSTEVLTAHQSSTNHYFVSDRNVAEAIVSTDQLLCVYMIHLIHLAHVVDFVKRTYAM